MEERKVIVFPEMDFGFEHRTDIQPDNNDFLYRKNYHFK